MGQENFTVKDIKYGTVVCSKHFVGGVGPSLEHPDPIPWQEQIDTESKMVIPNDGKPPEFYMLEIPYDRPQEVEEPLLEFTEHINEPRDHAYFAQFAREESSSKFVEMNVSVFDDRHNQSREVGDIGDTLEIKNSMQDQTYMIKMEPEESSSQLDETIAQDIIGNGRDQSQVDSNNGQTLEITNPIKEETYLIKTEAPSSQFVEGPIDNMPDESQDVGTIEQPLENNSIHEQQVYFFKNEIKVPQFVEDPIDNRPDRTENFGTVEQMLEITNPIRPQLNFISKPHNIPNPVAENVQCMVVISNDVIAQQVSFLQTDQDNIQHPSVPGPEQDYTLPKTLENLLKSTKLKNNWCSGIFKFDRPVIRTLNFLRRNPRTGQLDLELSIDSQFNLKLSVFGKIMDENSHEIVQKMPHTIENESDIQNSLDMLDKYKICKGVTEKNLLEYYGKRTTGFFNSNSSFRNLHSNNCKLLIDRFRRCNECNMIRNCLRRRNPLMIKDKQKKKFRKKLKEIQAEKKLLKAKLKRKEIRLKKIQIKTGIIKVSDEEDD